MNPRFNFLLHLKDCVLLAVPNNLLSRKATDWLLVHLLGHSDHLKLKFAG